MNKRLTYACYRSPVNNDLFQPIAYYLYEIVITSLIGFELDNPRVFIGEYEQEAHICLL
jgi:hypothetical protein